MPSWIEGGRLRGSHGARSPFEPRAADDGVFGIVDSDELLRFLCEDDGLRVRLAGRGERVNLPELVRIGPDAFTDLEETYVDFARDPRGRVVHLTVSDPRIAALRLWRDDG